MLELGRPWKTSCRCGGNSVCLLSTSLGGGKERLDSLVRVLVIGELGAREVTLMLCFEESLESLLGELVSGGLDSVVGVLVTGRLGALLTIVASWLLAPLLALLVT
mmetsp:Transcript_58194/g.173132  ORF Transcript_58194/g.173132 Transcript_58194/m.173132 type:complete len:106 (-) Transcript_58194:984-1301(-)